MDQLVSLSLYDLWIWWVNAPLWVSIPSALLALGVSLWAVLVAALWLLTRSQ